MYPFIANHPRWVAGLSQTEMEGNDQGVGFDTFRLVLFVILLVSLLSPGNHGQSSNLRETEEQKRMKKE